MSTEAIVTAIVAAIIFCAGWAVEGWRKDGEIARIAQSHEQALTQAKQSNLDKLLNAQRLIDRLQARLVSSEAERDQLTQEKTDAIRRLTVGRRCLDSAAVGVLNQPQRPGLNAGPLPQAASQPVPDDAAFATDTDVGIWAAEAIRAYDTCRGRLQAIADFYEGQDANE